MLGARTLGWLLVAAWTTVGCGSTEQDAGERPALEGIYQASGDGAFAFSWASMQGDHYVLWSSAPECNDDVASAPATCAESGTFGLNAANDRITFTDEATGNSRTLGIHVTGSRERSLLAPQGLLGPQQSLIEASQGPLATQFTLDQPDDGQLVHPVGLKETSFHLLVGTCLLLGNPASKPAPKDGPPLPITSSQCTGSSKPK